jgi:hypothetical protein
MRVGTIVPLALTISRGLSDARGREARPGACHIESWPIMVTKAAPEETARGGPKTGFRTARRAALAGMGLDLLVHEMLDTSCPIKCWADEGSGGWASRRQSGGDTVGRRC